MNGPVPPAAAMPQDTPADGLRAAAQALLSRGNHLQWRGGDGELELRAGVGQQHAAGLPCVGLDHAHGRLLLALEHEPDDSALGDAHWQDYSGDARLLAWTLTHEDLVAALGRLFGGGLLPAAFLAEGGRDWLWLALDWRDGQQRLTRGWLGMASADVLQLGVHEAWQRDPNHLSLLGDATALALNLLLPGRPLEAATIAALAPGDVLVVGDEADVEARLQPDRDTQRSLFGLPDGWSVQRQQGRWKIVDRPALQTMSPNRPQFLLTRLVLGPHDIEGLRPGSVLADDTQLRGSTVGIMLGGRRFGEGVLVALGGLLGVRITHKEGEHGLQ
ncbi:hypothetical protein ASG87_17805 [Frateuria sp. Soil773]|uniref:hypothetical protein n=1 Tax=Frateuria sp. Soil773 TaxID=1736407 RepID=UPI0006F62BB6|nr:hypothetical protein [Frateuria sp. Soil773]KRE94457.1 hypothetical protein ASG87_17805 [Frateuria sp. Soil773]